MRHSEPEWWYQCHLCFFIRQKTTVRIKGTAGDDEYIPIRKMLTYRKRPHSHGVVTVGLPQDNRFISVRFYGHCTGTMRQSCDSCTGAVRLSQEPTNIVRFFVPNDHLKSCVVRTISARPQCGVRAGIVRCYLRHVYGLRACDFFLNFVRIVRS